MFTHCIVFNYGMVVLVHWGDCSIHNIGDENRMPNTAKMNLVYGDRVVAAEFTGMDLSAQRDMMRMLSKAFFEDLDRELGFDREIEKEIVESENKEEDVALQQTADVLGMEATDVDAMAKAFSILKTAEKPNIELLQRKVPRMLDGLDSRTYRFTGTGVPLYQAFYVCKCRHKGKHYIAQKTPYVNCHECGARQIVRPAAVGPFPHVDGFGNFFIAGNFKREDEKAEYFSQGNAGNEIEENVNSNGIRFAQ